MNTGRVGEAASYGAGCWVQSLYNGPFQHSKRREKANRVIGSSVSGVGELIMKDLSAYRICSDILSCERKEGNQEEEEGEGKQDENFTFQLKEKLRKYLSEFALSSNLFCFGAKRDIGFIALEVSMYSSSSSPSFFSSIPSSAEDSGGSALRSSSVSNQMKGNDSVRFLFGHTTPSFGLGWMSESDKQPFVKLSRLGLNQKIKIGVKTMS